MEPILTPSFELAPEVVLAEIRSADPQPVWVRDDGATTVWRVSRKGGGDAFLKVDVDLLGEAERLRWLRGQLPVPEVLAVGSGLDSRDWLLTHGLPGVMAANPVGEEPSRVIEVLGETLRTIHSIPVTSCPFISPVGSELEDARRRLRDGVRWQCWHPFHARWVPAPKLIEELEGHDPGQASTATIHGDYCLPNVLLADGRLTGVLDLGHFGQGDPGFDLVAADGSGRRNLRQDWDFDRFLAAYGAQPDPARLRWLRLLRASLVGMTTDPMSG